MQHVKTDIVHRVDLTDADVDVILKALDIASKEVEAKFQRAPEGSRIEEMLVGTAGKMTERYRQLESIQRKGREGRIAGKGAQ